MEWNFFDGSANEKTVHRLIFSHIAMRAGSHLSITDRLPPQFTLRTTLEFLFMFGWMKRAPEIRERN